MDRPARPNSPIGLAFFRHFEAKFLTKRLNIRGVVIVYLVPSMKFYRSSRALGLTIIAVFYFQNS